LKGFGFFSSTSTASVQMRTSEGFRGETSLRSVQQGFVGGIRCSPPSVSPCRTPQARRWRPGGPGLGTDFPLASLFPQLADAPPGLLRLRPKPWLFVVETSRERQPQENPSISIVHVSKELGDERQAAQRLHREHSRGKAPTLQGLQQGASALWCRRLLPLL